MKSALIVVGAGGTFAGAVILGLALGVWLNTLYGHPYFVVITLFAGLLLGGYAAYRLVSAAI